MLFTLTLLSVSIAAIPAYLWRRADGAKAGLARQLEQAREENAALRGELAAARATAAEFARSEDQLQHIVSLLPVALFLKDPDSRIIMMNAACERIFGVEFAKLSGTRGSAYYPADQQEAFLAGDRAAFASGKVWMEEEWLWHAGLQEDRRLQTYKQAVYDSDGKPAVLIGMCIDVTERLRADDALQQSLRQLRQLSDHKQTVHEDERRRLALYAHDALGQNLMALKLDCSMLHMRTAHGHPRLHARAGCALTTLDESIQAVRTLINELHPSTLELGLPAAVDWLLKQMERSGGIDCQLHVLNDEGQETLPPRTTWAMFRMIQEALANISASARATRLDVTLDLGREALLVVIGDNGIGMPDGAAPFGMLALRERVAALAGEVAVSHAPGKGTTLTIRLPGTAQRDPLAEPAAAAQE